MIKVDTPTPPCCSVVAFNVLVIETLFAEFIIIAAVPEPDNKSKFLVAWLLTTKSFIAADELKEPALDACATAPPPPPPK